VWRSRTRSLIAAGERAQLMGRLRHDVHDGIAEPVRSRSASTASRTAGIKQYAH